MLQATRPTPFAQGIVRPKTKLLRLDGSRVLTVPVADRPRRVSQSDWETVCRVNDAIVKRVRYDRDRARSANSRTLQTPQVTLARGLGICTDYATLFEVSARRVNIKAKSVISDSMNHAWNMVCLGGEWWNVDVTWNAGGVFADGSPMLEPARADPDFRRRYLLTTSDSERELFALGLISQTHMVEDIRDIDFTRTLRALALIAHIEALLGVEGPHDQLTQQVGPTSSAGYAVQMPVGHRGEQIARLYKEYLRLEESYPLAVTFRLGSRPSRRTPGKSSK
ncbi:hypothetical protein BN11_4780002 [Nostocoides australiense Ben110]|uniref:Transglutaminase-like domain-containing protein n=1 Tax=Nostocoides australiense Ben110 TaxID=1193182 RepID=W6K4C1_9MICO|nr:hypothetical protein BN11_4780002 [Tetrasphaera australiensis Ben110]